MGALGALTAICFFALIVYLAVVLWEPLLERFPQIRTVVPERLLPAGPAADVERALPPESQVIPEPAMDPEAAWKPAALTEEERRLAEELLSGPLKPQFDEIQEEYTYSTMFDSSVILFTFVQFGSEELSPLLVSVEYEGETSLYMDEVDVRIGEELFSFPLNRVERAVTHVGTEEVAYEEAAHWKPMLDRLMESDQAVITLRGRGGAHDREIPQKDIENLRHTLLVFRYLGGVW